MVVGREKTRQIYLEKKVLLVLGRKDQVIDTGLGRVLVTRKSCFGEYWDEPHCKLAGMGD